MCQKEPEEATRRGRTGPAAESYRSSLPVPVPNPPGFHSFLKMVFHSLPELVPIINQVGDPYLDEQW